MPHDSITEAFTLYAKTRSVPISLFKKRFRVIGDMVIGALDGDEYLTAIFPHTGIIEYRDFPDGTATLNTRSQGD